ncbi:MAG TPA: prepilin-type N-terminal cleavage/methylation domain-containing protein [Terriglobales bacterium]|jgi:type IV pilus assembly protein PilA|nr:prepilin-type N-terminal cleavage/methylation domain-containing protein [Terriglobales bacterium]
MVAMQSSQANSRPASLNRGFSLIELLIVVAIILIIAAIAIPNLLRARIASNEASATNSIRSINTAEFAYNAAFPDNGFAATLTNLGGAAPCTPAVAGACLIDNVLATATVGSNGKNGYVFAATGVSPSGPSATLRSFVSGASPINYNISGVRNFCSTEDGVIRFDPGSGGSIPVNTSAACQAFTSLQ